MADYDKDKDEYHYVDIDASPDPIEDPSSTFQEKRPGLPTYVNRYVVGAILTVIFFLLIYFFLFSPVPEKSVDMQPLPSSMPSAVQTLPIAEPVVIQTNSPPPTTNSQLDDKLSTLEANQQSTQSGVSSLSNQVSGINNNLSTLTDKVTQLNQSVSELVTRLEEQSRELERLMAKKSSPPKFHRAVRHKSVPASPRYYIQAVIPGRAWLIGRNGATLTVSEGAIIPGYGMVKLIDPNQGRVLTSSGMVIRFSQQDS